MNIKNGDLHILPFRQQFLSQRETTVRYKFRLSLVVKKNVNLIKIR